MKESEYSSDTDDNNRVWVMSCSADRWRGGRANLSKHKTRHNNIDDMHQSQTHQKLKLECLWALSGTQKLLRIQKTRSKDLRNHSRTCKKDIFSSKRIAQKEGESPWFDPELQKAADPADISELFFSSWC